MGEHRDDQRSTQPAGPAAGGATLTRDSILDDRAADGRPAELRPLAPSQLRDPDRYLVLGEHGRGGLGRVSRAHDRELGRDVAIKELISRGRMDEVRFLREALITARLEHPSIVPVHEAGRWPDGTAFYAMKLVSGRPLRELIAERPAVADRIGLLHHVIAVADAIAYAHGRNIIHRDLKPANVIVGDFGETVVIDWGLAKDLTAADEPAIENGLSRVAHDSELTTTGSVLGTPAYMAPEQERGEHVDQRADVFAIGAMLWELCALGRPPRDADERRRELRRAGIDRDLAAIIHKALDPEPAGRYADAGALASDLKAFTSGARIAARHYSVLATLARWIRRHRGLALSLAAALAVVAMAAVVFVWNIAIERDRADAARERAEVANSALILEHAELLLHTDPTAAVAALSGYRGSDALRRRRLLAEAEGRGVARAVLAPHTDTIWFAVADPDGAIVSLGEDRHIRLTRDGISTTLASDASTAVTVVYAPSTRLVAYATSPNGIAVLDVRARTTRRISAINPAAMRFSPDGSRLAVLDDRGALEVWSIVPGAPGAPGAPDVRAIHRAVVPGAVKVRFMTSSRLVVQDRAVIRAIALDAAGGAADTRALPDVTSFDAGPALVAAGTGDGRVVLLGPDLGVLGETSLCHGQVRYARLIPRTDRLAFSCQEKTAGVARHDPARHGLTIIDTFATRGLADVAPDATGRYVVVTDESNTAYIYDTATRLLTHYEGTAGQPSYVAAPTPEFAHVLIGDVNGTVRVWDPPSAAARVVLQAPDAIFGLAFAPDGKAFFTGGVDDLVRRIDPADGAVTELRGHGGVVLEVRAAPDGASIVSMSYDRTLRTWRTRDGAQLRELSAHGSVVQDADYIEGGRRVASVGEDGRLLVWSPGGDDVAELFHHDAPLTGIEVLSHNDHMVIKDVAGSIWDVAPDGKTRKLRDADGAAVTALRASPDGRYLAAGTAAGTVAIYETSGWRIVDAIKTDGTIGQIRFDPLGRDLVIASEAGRAPSGHVVVVPLGAARRFHWRDIPAAVRDLAYTSDGETLGFACADGGTWLYSVPRDAWAYTRDHDNDVLGVAFSPDGKLFVTTDRRGAVVVRDVPATWNARGHSPSSGVP